MFLYFFILLSLTFSQEQWYNHPELDWKSMETEHFIICFHQGVERSAQEVAEVAETVFESVTKLYDFIPENKTTIIIKDVDDYSNGAAYFFDNKIIISGKPMDYDLRGAHRWLQDVITHEYVHIVQLAASMKYTRHVPGSYIQVLEYENEKREDVLYGYPNQILSYPIPNTTVPPWFAEGVAQYMYEGANYDYWDSVRDMILRDRVINNNLLSYNEMNTFGKKGIGNESAYNQGFSLVKYIVREYGEDSLRKITKALSNPFTYSIDKAIKSALGITGNEIYDSWKIELEMIYFSQIPDVSIQNEYLILEEDGSSNIHPVWSPSADKFAFLSNVKNDYFGKTDLYIYDLEDSTKEKIQVGIKSAATWINDTLIVYSKKSKPDLNGSKFFDLYSYDIIEEEEEQLTEGLRLFSPFYDKNEKKIYAINTFDGSSNILVGNQDFSEYEQLTNLNDGTQIFSLFINDGKVLFDAVINHERDIYEFKKNEKLNKIVKWDRRDPVLFNGVMISSNDRYGIFNLYSSSNFEQGYLTNVSGGAFMPDVSSDGKILFSLYENGVYKIALLTENQLLDKTSIGIQNNQFRSDFKNYNSNDYYFRPMSELIDEGIIGDISDYEIDMTGPYIMPRLMFDNGVVKPGFYLYDNDYLDKLTVLGGFDFNKNKDIDIFLLFENKRYKFTYFFNFYFVTRNISKIHEYVRNNGQLAPSQRYYVDYTYHLFLADIGSRFIIKDHEFWLTYSFSKYRQFYDVRHTQETVMFSDYEVGDGAYNYFDGQSIKLDYEYEARSQHYLFNMLPRKGFVIKASMSYEKNNIFEEFRANEQIGIKEYLAPHNTGRNEFDVSAYWTIGKIKNSKRENYLTLSNNLKYMNLTNKKVDDFLYFFGGGLPGLKGYTFYDPILQGTNFMLMTNSISYPIFTEKAHKVGFIYLNSMSIGLVHQLGKSSSGKIMTYSGAYNIPAIYQQEFSTETNGYSIEDYVIGEISEIDALNAGVPLCYGIGQFDALDVNDCIPDYLEQFIYPDIYFEYLGWTNSSLLNENHMSIRDLKEAYSKAKQSIGLEFKLYGFSFYSYPTALTYEYHMPISDKWNSDGRHYLRLLFDFN